MRSGEDRLSDLLRIRICPRGEFTFDKARDTTSDPQASYVPQSEEAKALRAFVNERGNRRTRQLPRHAIPSVKVRRSHALGPSTFAVFRGRVKS